ncbi:MAG: hypothetical protein IKW10_03975 [Oscillospiraceae bacterium]|nr:hypothetical protein [Oscillospiraceae bacterium]
MCKRILSVMLAVLLLLGIFPANVSAQGTTTVLDWQISLADLIGATFYLDVPKDADDAAVNITVDGQTTTYDLVANDQGQYPVTVKLAAAQMTEEITLQMVSRGREYAPVSYTIRDYAIQILTGNYSDNTKTFVKHMLDYGTASQNYFGINTDKPANEGYVLDYTARYPTSELIQEGQISGVSFYGASLVMDSRLAVRYYFDAESLEGMTFRVNGTTYQPQGNYVEVSGIAPAQYGADMVLTATTGEETLVVTYSPLTYVVRMSQKGSDATKALANAMYGYYEAALACDLGVTVNLPMVAGGNVTTDKAYYKWGDMVTVTAAPAQGYSLKRLAVKKNGQIVDSLLPAGGNFCFLAQDGVYTVEAEFDAPVFTVVKGDWDLSNQHNGSVTIVNQKAGTSLITNASNYTGVSVTVKDHTTSKNADGSLKQGDFSAQIYFIFDDGMQYQVRIHNTDADGNYKLQHMGEANSLTLWKWQADLTTAQKAKLMDGDGVEFSVKLVGANAQLWVDGSLMKTVALGDTYDGKAAQIKIVMNGNIGIQNLQIPFVLTRANADDILFQSSQLSKYVIVYDSSNSYYLQFANRLKTRISERYGVDLPVVSDHNSIVTAHEILLGDTNRYNDPGRVMEYAVTVDEGVFRIKTGGPYSADNAVTYLCEQVFNGQAVSLHGGEHYRTCLLTSSREITDGTSARVMSANLLADVFNNDDTYKTADYRAEIFAGMLVSYTPDVIGLQEVNKSWSSALDFYLQRVKELYGMEYSKCWATYEGKTNYTCLLYRSDKFKVENGGVEVFSWWKDLGANYHYHMRNISWAQFASLENNDEKFVVANTHWSYRLEHAEGDTYLTGSGTPIAADELRTQCMNETKTVMASLNSKYSAMPIFLVGDFNTPLSFFASDGWLPASYHVISTQAQSNGTALSTVPVSGHYDHLFGVGNYSVKLYEFWNHVNHHSALTDHPFVYADLAFDL